MAENSFATIAERLERSRLTDAFRDRFDGAGRGWASLLRIAAFAVAWLLVAGLVFPDATPDPEALPLNVVDPLPSEVARTVTLDRRDERGFATSGRTDGFRVAWVGGSTLQEVDGDGGFTFIPGLAAQRLTANGGDVDVDIYLLEAARILDLYVATLAAIESEPDALVVALNPLLSLNGAAVQTWDNLDGRLVALASTDPGMIPIAAGFASPADVGWGLVGRHLVPFADRWEWGRRISQRTNVGDLLEPPPPAASEEPGALERVAALQLPVRFWITGGDATSDETRIDRQLDLWDLGSEFDDSLNTVVLRRLLDAVVGADIPVVLYVPPLRLDVPGTAVEDRRAALVRALAELTPATSSPGVDVDLAPLALSDESLRYVDLLHVMNGQPVATTVAERLCGVLIERGIPCSLAEEPPS